MNRGDRGQRKGVMSLTSAAETTKKRELMTIAIRKQKREEAFLKRRHVALAAGSPGSSQTASPSAAPQTSTPSDPVAATIVSLLDALKRASSQEELAAASQAVVCCYCINHVGALFSCFLYVFVYSGKEQYSA